MEILVALLSLMVPSLSVPTPSASPPNTSEGSLFDGSIESDFLIVLLGGIGVIILFVLCRCCSSCPSKVEDAGAQVSASLPPAYEIHEHEVYGGSSLPPPPYEALS